MKMKIAIGNYEIDIKAKRPYSPKANKGDTFAFLCSLSSYAYEAAERREQLGCPALAKEAHQIGEEIYNFLDGKHYFDDVREEK